MKTMPDQRIPMARVDITPDDIDAVSAVLRSGALRQGEVTARFEDSFARRVGARHAVAVSSGTAALHLAYLALFEPGDEVIVPAFTFVATASMLRAVGAVPVFADVDPRTFALSAADVEHRITPRTRGIAGVHLFGNACDVDALRAVAARHGLALVWDAAQSLGTEYRGREAGSYPVAACYSFYPTKNITTGEGGMVVTDDPGLAAALRLSRSQGAAAKYLHTGLGFNYRMTDLAAALGLRQLARLDSYLARRRENAARLTAGLAGAPGVLTPQVTEHASHTYNQYCVLIGWPDGPGPGRDSVASALAGYGVETAVHYPRPLHRQPIFDGQGEGLEVSERLSEHILALPVHPGIAADQAAAVAAAVVDVVTRGA
ncbi:MAG: DegT/DnrJ/EryC1/StrS family aminotransferase [Actinomycetota bacterium]|jgi:perosamine synthetase|nr:DegT/DnrJ/EryC1/StrS family aminotransferase [Actinomycetota bacterium]